MNKKFRKLVLPVSLLIASQSYGLGLGGLQVNSALDEVLNGEIPFIIDSSENIENIEVSVASSAEYKRVGLDKTYVPSNIDVSVIDNNGKKNIQISSRGPISEPIVSLLLVVNWENGHLLREYTLLLDPPIFLNTQQNPPEVVQTQTYTAPTKIESKPQATQETTQTKITNTYNESNQVVVESGDTLWKIASKHNDGYSSPQQTMVAIFNNNPGAFQNNDMNFLKKGATLTIPSTDQISMISNGQAIAEVNSATQNWSRQQTSSDEVNVNDSVSSSDYGIELVPPNDSDLSDSSNSSGTSNNSKNKQTIADLNRAKEELISLNLENEDLSSRLSELEKLVEDQKNALSLKDNNLAQLQQQLSEADAIASTESSSEETMSDDVWDDTDQQQAETDASDSMAVADELMVDESMVDDSMVDDSMVDDSMAEEDDRVVISDTDTVDSSEAILDNDSVIVAEESAAIKEQSFMDKLLNYKFEGLIALGVLLLGILGFVFFKRKNGNEETSESGFLDSISNGEKPALDGSTTELDLSNLDEDLVDETDTEEDLVNLDDETIEKETLIEDIAIEDSDLEVLDSDDLDMDIDLDLDLNTDLSEETLDDNTKVGSEVEENADISDFGNLDLDFEVTDDDLEAVTGDSDETEDPENDEYVLEDSLDLDFDLENLEDIGNLTLDDEDNSEEVTESNSVEDLLEEDLDLDLDLDSDFLDNVVNDTEELEDLVFDTGERTVIPDVGEPDVGLVSAEEELEDLEFELDDDLFNSDELELSLDDEPENTIDDDLTELNLTTLDESFLDSNELDSEEDVDIGFDFDDLGGDDAIDTKLDLAKAYFEMGDVEGAKQMVVEIIEEGTEEQKSKAEALNKEIEGS